MNPKINDWVLVEGYDDLGRITQIIGSFFRADFLREDGVEHGLDLIPILCIEKIITNPAEIEMLEKEYKGEFYPI